MRPNGDRLTVGLFQQNHLINFNMVTRVEAIEVNTG